MLDRPKKPQVSTSTSRSALDVALDLRQAIDRLWIHSEILYDFYHGIKAPKDGSSAIEWQISRSLYVRNEAIALYQACQRSTQHCELDIDLLRDRSMPPDPQTTLYPAFDTSIFYQIFVRSGDGSKLNTWDITAKSLDKTEAAAVSSTVKVHKEPDFSVFKSSSPSSTIGIQPSYSRENYYFRVTTAHTIAEPLSKNESSALPFKSNTISTEVGTSHFVTFMAKIDLAYNLIRCGFYLLGTLWLASLFSKSLRRIETKRSKGFRTRYNDYALGLSFSFRSRRALGNIAGTLNRHDTNRHRTRQPRHLGSGKT